MGFLDQSIHLLNFAAPAVALALLMPLIGRLVMPGRGAGLGFLAQAVIGLVTCLAILALGLWWWGRDGKMLTYAAMATASASAQWLMSRGWKSR